MEERKPSMNELQESQEQAKLRADVQGYIRRPEVLQGLGLSDVQSVSCTPLEGGHMNVTYLVKVNDDKKFVARFYPDSSHGGDRTKREYDNMKKLEGIEGHPAPRALYLGEAADFTHGSPVLITEFAEGEHKNFNDLSETEIRNFARVLGSLHGITREGTFTKNPDEPEDKEGNQADYLQSHIAHYSQWLLDCEQSVPEDGKKPLQDAQKEMQKQLGQHGEAFAGRTFSYLHDDIVTANVLWNNEKPVLIDWEAPGFGDRADDVAYIFAVNNTSDDFQQTFLDEYERHVDDPTLRERVPVYMLKNRFMDVAWAITKLHEEATGSNPMMEKEEGLYESFYDVRLKALKECLEATDGVNN